MNRTNKVLLIYTGGTIGMGHNPRTGALEPLDFNHLVDNVPEFKLIPTEVDTYQFDLLSTLRHVTRALEAVGRSDFRPL